MQQQFIDSITKFNQVSINATKDLIDINTRAVEKFSEKQVELTTEGFEAGVKQMQAVSEIKTVQDLQGLISAQTADIKTYGEKIQANIQDSMNMLSESSDELNTWMKKGMDAAATVSVVKTAPAKAKKAA